MVDEAARPLTAAAAHKLLRAARHKLRHALRCYDEGDGAAGDGYVRRARAKAEALLLSRMALYPETAEYACSGRLLQACPTAVTLSSFSLLRRIGRGSFGVVRELASNAAAPLGWLGSLPSCPAAPGPLSPGYAAHPESLLDRSPPLRRCTPRVRRTRWPCLRSRWCT